MKFEDFTPKERYVIAEFVYSEESDILIKGDGHDLIELFKNKNIIDSVKAEELNKAVDTNANNIVSQLTTILRENVSNEEGAKIMQEYFGGDAGVL